MDIVRFDSQERVDLPDMTQVSFLVLGEFRRTIRSLIHGEDEKRIIEGFAVEAEATPSSRIVIKLDNGGAQPYSLAILPENTGSLEYGQLVGGIDSAGNTEGNAQQIIDFSAEPTGTYTVEMKFVPYTDSTGANDNRAFWDEGANSESISATDTRYKAQWQAQIVLGAGTGGEWIELATVSWTSGGTIASANITDARAFLLEGTAPFRTTDRHSYAAIADFDRGTSRQSLSIGVNQVVPALRALMLQVLDIKGPDADGYYNWYGRTFQAHGIDAATDKQTKSLRTIDTVTYTIGDGTTTFGDFNGADGLEDCLQHLEDQAASAPANVVIELRSNATTSFEFNITNDHPMNAVVKRMSIDFQGNTLACSHTAATSALTVSGTLELRNIGAGSSSNNATFFEANKLTLRNVALTGHSSATAEPAVKGGSGTIIEGCQLTGLTQLTNPQSAPAGTDDVHATPCLASGSIFNAIQVTDRTAGNISMPLIMKGCLVRQSTSHGYGISAAVDLGNNAYCRIEDSTIIFNGDGGDGVRAASANSESATRCVVSGCAIEHSDTGAATGGTWGIRLSGGADHHVSDCDFDCSDVEAGGIGLLGGVSRVSIRGCTFRSASGTRTAIENSAIYLLGSCEQINISGCHFDGWDANQITRSRVIVVGASSAVKRLNISNCNFEDNGVCVDLTPGSTAPDGVTICGCSIQNTFGNAGEGIYAGAAENVAVTGNNFNLGTASDNPLVATGGHGVAVGNIAQAGSGFSVPGTWTAASNLIW